jgi:hypothetical protein
MALLRSGVDIAVIELWLDHESIETTNAYVCRSCDEGKGAWKGPADGYTIPDEAAFGGRHRWRRVLRGVDP